MLIRVIYSNKRTGLVCQNELDDLLANRSLAAFRRADSWAVIGEDPIRSGSGRYHGPDRRGAEDGPISRHSGTHPAQAPAAPAARCP